MNIFLCFLKCSAYLCSLEVWRICPFPCSVLVAVLQRGLIVHLVFRLHGATENGDDGDTWKSEQWHDKDYERYIQKKNKYIYYVINMMSFFSNVNSLWFSDPIRRYRPWSTLAQVMACCLTAPSHYLNQCWLIIINVYTFKIITIYPRDLCVKWHPVSQPYLNFPCGKYGRSGFKELLTRRLLSSGIRRVTPAAGRWSGLRAANVKFVRQGYTSRVSCHGG